MQFNKETRSRIKRISFVGPFLVYVKQILKNVMESVKTLLYCLRSNLDYSEGDLFINDRSNCNSAERGFFSIFREVLDIIASNGKKNIQIEYYNTLYNNNNKENMWDYYFYPINNDKKKKYIRFFVRWSFRDIYSAENPKEVALFYEVINQRIKFKDEISDKVERFWTAHLKNKKTIGVHYRGTDIQASLDMYAKTIKKANNDDYFSAVDFLIRSGYDMIFLATDDEKVLKIFKERYGDKLVYRESERSKNGRGIHFLNANRRQQGEDVIIDALLLSKCDFFLYGYSNVSTVVKYLNPFLKSKNMSHI